MSIVTVTLNVAIDQTITLDALIPGNVQRAKSVRYNAGGKGVNVASCLADWGTGVSVTGFLGQENAALFQALCKKKKIDNRFVTVDGASRINIKLVDEHETETTDINLPGITADATALLALNTVLDEFSTLKPGIAVLAGSLPGGCPEDIYANQTKKLTESGFRVLLDASGPALRAALAATPLPFCIKPNRGELSEWAGKELDTTEAILDQAKILHKQGIALVVVSLGQDGALFLSNEGALVARTQAPNIVSTVGAGDAMVAGIAAALDESGSLERIARLSTAFAATKLGILGPNLPDKATVESIAQKVEVRHVMVNQA